jgi:4'-phosphopantetheinyl transferase
MNRKRIVREPPFLWCGLPTADLDEQILAWLGHTLDDEEHARIDSLRLTRARRDAIAAHGLRRLLLASVTGRPAGSFRFYTDYPGGKPKTAGIPGLDVSLTHCDGYAAAVVGKDGRFGIDAEPLCRHIEPELVAPVTAPNNKRSTNDTPIVVWTMKEALTKAEGSGLALNITRLEIDPCAPRLVTAPTSFGNPAGWKLERHCHAGFIVAIAFGPRVGR